MSGADSPPAFAFIVWPFDPAAWGRIQRAVKRSAEGDSHQAWNWIDQGLLFASIEQQRRSLPSLQNIRERKQQLLATIDSLTSQLGIEVAQPLTEPRPVDGEMLNWLVHGALRDLHPTGPPLGDNRRRNPTPVHQAFAMFKGHYGEAQIGAQTLVLELLEKLRLQLGLLRELAAASLADTSRVNARGTAVDLTRFTFVDYTATAYETAYRRPARAGSLGDSAEAGPAVRFIAAVAEEARKAKTIAPLYRAPLLEFGLHVTPNGIRRLLGKRAAR